MPTSPLPFWGSPTLSAGTKFKKWLRGPHVGKMPTSLVPSWEYPTLSTGTKIRNGYVAHMWAKWLHQPCRRGGPQHSARGQKSEMATCPTCGQNGYITPAVLGVPNVQCGDKNQKWLRGPHVGKVATSPLPSWGSPTLSAGTKIRNKTGIDARGVNLFLASDAFVFMIPPDASGCKTE